MRKKIFVFIMFLLLCLVIGCYFYKVNPFDSHTNDHPIKYVRQNQLTIGPTIFPTKKDTHKFYVLPKKIIKEKNIDTNLAVSLDTEQNNRQIVSEKVSQTISSGKLLKHGTLISLYKSAEILVKKYNLNRSVMIINEFNNGLPLYAGQISDFFKEHDYIILGIIDKPNANEKANQGIIIDRLNKTDIKIEIGVDY